MKKNTDAIVKMAKEKSQRKYNTVMDEIDKMIEEGVPITFYKVEKRTGASKGFLYNNEEISKRIKSLRDID